MSVENIMGEAVEDLNLVDVISSEGEKLSGEVVGLSEKIITLRIGEDLKRLYRYAEQQGDDFWKIEGLEDD